MWLWGEVCDVVVGRGVWWWWEECVMMVVGGV